MKRNVGALVIPIPCRSLAGALSSHFSEIGSIPIRCARALNLGR
jgi:hypothetical protein